MVRVNNDLDITLPLFVKESEETLKKYNQQRYFRPDKKKKQKKAMKKRNDKRAGGRQSYVQRSS